MTATTRAVSLLAAGLAACGSPAGPGSTSLSTPPDFTAAVTWVDYQDFYSPAGHVRQYDLWVATPPGSPANTGVVIGRATPVFLRGPGGNLTPSAPDAIRAGEAIEVWHDATVGYGAVQAPPGAPVYSGIQIVILPPAVP